jgi:hypothetical protein
MSEVCLNAAGRPRSPATLPGFHAGRPPRNKGRRYPADPPTVAEIVAVMRDAGIGVSGARLRALIVVLWRAGLRIHEALALGESDLDQRRGSLLVRRGKGGRRREVGMDGLGPGTTPAVVYRARGPARWAAAVHRHGADAWTGMVSRRRAHRAAPRRRAGRCAQALRAASAPSRARRRDGPRGPAADRHPTPARAHQPRDHFDLSPAHRQHGDHRHRPRAPPADGPGRRNAPPLTAKRPAVGRCPLRQSTPRRAADVGGSAAAQRERHVDGRAVR